MLTTIDEGLVSGIRGVSWDAVELASQALKWRVKTGPLPADVYGTPDDRSLLVNRYISASQAEVWRVDLGSGQRTRLLPRDGDPRALFPNVIFFGY